MVKEWEEKERDLDYTGVSKVQIMSYFKKKKKKGSLREKVGKKREWQRERESLKQTPAEHGAPPGGSVSPPEIII